MIGRIILKDSLMANKEWTEGRLKAFITSTLRGGFRKYPPKYESLKEAQVGKKINDKSQRMAMHYECNKCKGHFPNKEVQVDHILPVVCPKKGFESWDIFIARLFCSSDNLQVLCKGCHDEKTKTERVKRVSKRTAS